MSAENPFSTSPMLTGNEEVPKRERSPEEEVISAEQSINERLAEFFKKPEIGQYPGSERVFVRIELGSEEDFTLALELLSVVGIDPWDDVNARTITVDNRFDIEMLIERDILSLDAFREDSKVAEAILGSFSSDDYELRALPNTFPLEDVKSIPEIFEKEGKETSPFDSMSEGEAEKMYYGDTSYLYRQFSKKYSRKPGELYRKKDQGRQLISAEEQAEMLEKAKADDRKARNELLIMNMGLVYFVMLNVSRRFPWVNQADLLQEGLIQLDKCIDGYDKNDPRQAKFSTYAVVSMEWKMYSWIQKNRPYIDMPVHVQESIYKLNKLENIQNSEEGRKITPHDLAKELAISQSAAEQLIEDRDMIYNAEFLDIEEIDDSYEVLISDENTYETAKRNELVALMPEMLDALPTREAKVIRMRFGIDLGGQEMSLEEIGKVLGVSGEAVRRTEAQAFRKLKHPVRANLLRGYLEPENSGYAYDPLIGDGT